MPFPRNSKPETRNSFSILFPILRFWLRKTRPRTSGAVALTGLTEKVSVSFDRYAVPHICAASERDLFLAQGYLHARERLWQMDLNRRAVSGRMAEIFGDRPLPRGVSAELGGRTFADLDYFIRLAGMRRAARASLGCLTEREAEILDAYSAGVNRYIETHLKSPPLEFRLLRYEPEPWRPEDCLTLGKGFAFFLSTSFFTRVAWIALADGLKNEPEKLKSLLPRYPSGGPSITRPCAAAARGLLGFMSGTFDLYGAAAGQGSNSWVVAPGRSATGAPILCNDPHLRLELPSTWYLMHLRAAGAKPDADFEVWGGSIPGMPCVHVGRNRRIAWGVTAALCDDADLYRETVHPERPDVYRAGAAWTEMRTEEEKIALRGGKSVARKIRFTRHGPLVGDFIRGSGGADKEALAFKWTAHAPSRELRAVYGVNRAENWEEFRRAIAHQTAPSLNYLYADSGGNIGYSLAGAVPLRAGRPSLLPLDGAESKAEWQGSIPFDELPHLYNPPEGVIATANNDVAGGGYEYYLSDLFDPPYRIRRIRELLAGKKTLAVADMERMQQDTVSVHAREIVEALGADLARIAASGGASAKAAESLLAWDGGSPAESREAAVFQFFYHRLTENLLQPTLGENLFSTYIEIFNQSVYPLEQILKDPASPWFAAAPRPALVEKSLEQACGELARRLGPDMEQWQWGKVHTLGLGHPLDAVWMLRRLISIEPFPTGGDGVTINMGFFRRSHPYEHTVGPSLRMILDLAVPGRSLFVLVPGQSGHFLSPHYRDQTDLWRGGGYIEMAEDEKTAGPLVLTPQYKVPDPAAQTE